MDDFLNEKAREAMEKNIAYHAQQLQHTLVCNEAETVEERKVHTAILVCGGPKKDGIFIALNGSAHRLYKCFDELFTRRPELATVVRDVLDGKYHVMSDFELLK